MAMVMAIVGVIMMTIRAVLLVMMVTYLEKNQLSRSSLVEIATNLQ